MLGNNFDWTGIKDVSLFKPHSCDLGYKVVNLRDARKLYFEETYLDSATHFWEIYRTEVINKNLIQEWEIIFEKSKIYAQKAYESSVKAQRLAVFLGINKTLFISDIPCSGASIERLLRIDWKNLFFNKALSVYQAGYWICGIENNNFIICGETPDE